MSPSPFFVTSITFQMNGCREEWNTRNVTCNESVDVDSRRTCLLSDVENHCFRQPCWRPTLPETYQRLNQRGALRMDRKSKTARASCSTSWSTNDYLACVSRLIYEQYKEEVTTDNRCTAILSARDWKNGCASQRGLPPERSGAMGKTVLCLITSAVLNLTFKSNYRQRL
jgi:hypothetical protein